MNKLKLLKSILIPTLGISAIGSIAAVCTSCGNVSVKSVSLNKPSTTLHVGDTETLTATVLPTDATNKNVTWISSNTNIATVNSNGTITAKAIGTATITVKTNDGGKTATCDVTVINPIHVTSVSLNKTSTTLGVDETETLTVTVLPTDATDKSVTWTSSNTNVATVDNNGTITAKASGTATITVKTNDGGKTATCDVTVTSRYVVLTANEDSTLFLQNNGGNNPDLQYSTDGRNWTTYSTEISIDQGKSLYLKGNNPTGWSSSTDKCSTLFITGDVSIFGNVMGLLDNGTKSREQGDITGIPCEYCFNNLFAGSTGITSVSEDFLPATSLTNHCYASMFHSCTKLEKAPDLPATTLAESCYTYMFQECTSLTTAPYLPAITLTNSSYYCYQYIFKNCKSLNSIKIGYLSNYSDIYFEEWVNGVASSGTFYYNGRQNAQAFQLPSGWTKSPF